jgi:Mitochondrial carrier protein
MASFTDQPPRFYPYKKQQKMVVLCYHRLPRRLYDYCLYRNNNSDDRVRQQQPQKQSCSKLGNVHCKVLQLLLLLWLPHWIFDVTSTCHAWMPILQRPYPYHQQHPPPPKRLQSVPPFIIVSSPSSSDLILYQHKDDRSNGNPYFHVVIGQQETRCWTVLQLQPLRHQVLDDDDDGGGDDDDDIMVSSNAAVVVTTATPMWTRYDDTRTMSSTRRRNQAPYMDENYTFDMTQWDTAAAVYSMGSAALLTMVLVWCVSFSIPDTAHAVVVSIVTVPTTVPTTAIIPIVDWQDLITKASRKALGGGKAGAAAAIVQVCTLMWLRTCMNYQYRYGGTLVSSLQTLWKQGGISRLYQGLPFAIVQGPLTRFGDTAANVGILTLLDSIPATQEWPLPVKTLCGSVTAGLWRIVLMPIDASKTSLQVEGSTGLQKLWSSTYEIGPSVLYRGSLAQAAATAVGHFPWFLTYNFVNDILPVVGSTGSHSPMDPNTIALLSLARSAFLGFVASCVSDCSSNSLRVIKTTKQTAQLSVSNVVDHTNSNTTSTPTRTLVKDLSYPDVIQLIIAQDGILGLFGRGLQTRLLTNAIQGAMFSVLWKYFQQSNTGGV